ncbi:MAG TPA: hypothetical protein V6D15_08440 [Oculatellaceae cyanobacterium]|jgi:hypothetical protein
MDGIHHSYSVEYEVEEVDTLPVVEAVPEVVATEEEAAQKLESLVVEEVAIAPIPQPTEEVAAEKTDATEIITGTGDNLVTVEPVAVDPVPTDDKLLTAGDMAKLFPDIGSGTNPSQKFRDWAKSKGGKGKTELAKLGYEAVEIKEGSKTNYYFRKLP